MKIKLQKFYFSLNCLTREIILDELLQTNVELLRVDTKEQD